MKKITLVIPPFTDFYATPRRMAPLGAAVVQGMLEERGYPVTLLNLPRERKKPAPAPLPPTLEHLRPHILAGEHGPTAFFTTLKRWGPGTEEAAERILGTAPDLVLCSLFAWCYAAETAALVRALKARAPGLPVHIGGAGATANPVWLLEQTKADGILCGEAEAVLPGFLDCFEGRSSVPPRGCLRPGAVPETSVPRAATILPAAALAGESREGSMVSLSLTRGCPLGCAFCANHLCHGREFRTAPLDALDTALEKLPLRGSPVFNFEDDNLLLDREYFRAAVRRLRQRHPGCGLAAENGLDYRLLDPDMVTFLAESGFRRINLSLGTTSDPATRSQGRRLDLAQYERILAALTARGLPVTTFFICGLPGDSTAETAATLRYLADKPTVIGISPFYAVPGLPDFPPDHPGFAAGPDRSRGMALWPWTGTHSTAELATAFRLARFLNLEKTGTSDPLLVDLIRRTRESGRLHTLRHTPRGSEVEPVPGMDNALAAQVLGTVPSAS